MLVLPVDEDAWAFRACLCVGLALLVLDVVLPRVFHRRVRLRWPWRPPALPLRLHLPRFQPLTDERFRRQKRELKRLIRALERGEEVESQTVATADESDTRRTAREERKKKTTTKSGKRKAKSRVVLPGDRTETDGEASVVRNRMKKRVSFDMTQTEGEQSQRQPTPPATARVVRTSPITETARRMTEAKAPSPTGLVASKTDRETPSSVPSASHPDTTARMTTSTRPDPFSLVDDSFPWQLPNYARTAPAHTSHSSTITQSSVSMLQQPTPVILPGVTLNVRRPLGQVNGPSSGLSSTTLHSAAASGLELKQKPFWKRTPSKAPNPPTTKESPVTNCLLQTIATTSHFPQSTGQPQAADSAVSAATFECSNVNHSNVTSGHVADEEPRLLFRPDNALRPSPVPKRAKINNPFLPKSWRVPSPKPPLHSRSHHAASVATTASYIATPVAPQSKLRTPKIIRRITFDEDMMGALATPSDASPLITESTRKRQRDNDVLEALDAVGIPWHKRRLNG